MLQSPLSRKYSGSSNRGSAQNDLFKNYKSCATPSNDRAIDDVSRIGEEWSDETPIPKIEPWEVSALDDTETSAIGDTRKFRAKSTEPSRRYRDRSQDGRSSANSLSKYSSASSDEEGMFMAICMVVVYSYLCTYMMCSGGRTKLFKFTSQKFSHCNHGAAVLCFRVDER